MERNLWQVSATYSRGFVHLFTPKCVADIRPHQINNVFMLPFFTLFGQLVVLLTSCWEDGLAAYAMVGTTPYSMLSYNILRYPLRWGYGERRITRVVRFAFTEAPLWGDVLTSIFFDVVGKTFLCPLSTTTSLPSPLLSRSGSRKGIWVLVSWHCLVGCTCRQISSYCSCF